MPENRLPLLGIFALLCACGRQADWFPVPPQQAFAPQFDPSGVGPFVRMNDPDADDYIVRDIASNPGVFRWAFLHPELRFRVSESENLRFTAEIALPESIFPVTGPMHISYSINGKVLGTVYCSHPGKYELDKPVPSAWVPPNQYLRIEFSSDRHWISAEDGAQLSFLLFEAGFKH